jgi:PAS domain S-box-containing protein
MMNVAHEMTGINYWMVDLPSNTLFWSPGVFAIHGRDEALGTPELKDAIDAYHPQDRELVGTAVRRAIEEGAPLDFEARVVRADNGRVVNIRSLGTTIADANGTVTKLVGAFGDVTQDIKNAILLEHYAYVQEAFGIGFYSYDIENDLPYWSRGMSRMLGYDPDTHVPTIQSGLDIIHPEDRERVKGMMKKATEHGTDFEFDTRLLHKSGEQVRCHASGKVRLSQDRVPTHVYGSFRQIAE